MILSFKYFYSYRTERGRKFNAVVDQAGKAVSETTRAVGKAVYNLPAFQSIFFNVASCKIDATSQSISSHSSRLVCLEIS